jgi:hypothetical protein
MERPPVRSASSIARRARREHVSFAVARLHAPGTTFGGFGAALERQISVAIGRDDACAGTAFLH